MVDQLWMWVIDKPGKTSMIMLEKKLRLAQVNSITDLPPETIVSAFPRGWGKSSPSIPESNLGTDYSESDLSDFYERIWRALCNLEPKVASAADLTCLIINKCSGLFQPPTS